MSCKASSRWKYYNLILLCNDLLDSIVASGGFLILVGLCNESIRLRGV